MKLFMRIICIFKGHEKSSVEVYGCTPKTCGLQAPDHKYIGYECARCGVTVKC